MNREKKLIKNTLIIGFGTFLPKICGLITLPLITANLSRSDYGTYDLMNTIVALLLPVITLEIQSSAFRFLIEYRENKKEQKAIITNILFFTLVISVISVIILYFLFNKIESITKLLLCFYFITDIVFFTLQQITRGLSLNKLYSAGSIIVSVLNMILVIITVSFFNYALNGVVFSIAMSTFVAGLVLSYYSNSFDYIDFNLLSKDILKKMLSYSWPMVPNSLSNWIISLSDRLVVTYFMGIEYTAIYGIANKLPSLFTSMQGTFVLAWQENASLSSNDDDIDEYYGKMFDSISSILFTLISLLIVISPFLFHLLIKGDFMEAYFQMPFLYLGMYFSSIASFIGGIYVAAKKTKNVGYTTVFAAIINLIINILFIRFIGLYAASFSTFISYFVLAAYRMYDIIKYQKIKYNFKKIFLINIFLFLISFFNYFNNTILNILNCILVIILSCVFNRKIIYIIVNKYKK